MSGGILTTSPFILLVNYDSKGHIGEAYLGRTELMHVLIASQGESVVQDSYHISSALMGKGRAHP